MKHLSRGFLAVLLLLLLTGLPLKAADEASSGYHNYQELTQALKSIVGKNTKIAKLLSIGKSLKRP